MSDKNAQSMMSQTVEKIKTLVDANTIIGAPITCGEITAIPVSRVTYGLAAGGSDLPSKNANRELFAGGGGAGITIEPIGFLIVNGANVRMIPINPPVTALERVVEMIPDAVNRASSLVDEVKSRLNEKKQAPETPEEIAEKAAKLLHEEH